MSAITVSDGYVMFLWDESYEGWCYVDGAGADVGFNSIGEALQAFCRKRRIAEAEMDCVVDSAGRMVGGVDVSVYRIQRPEYKR